MSYQDQPQGGQPPYTQQPQQQFAQQNWAEPSQATMVLVFGILGFVVCQVFAPVAWMMGNKELAGIDAGRRSPEQRTLANVGRILGIVGTVILGFVIVAVLISIVAAVAGG